MAGIYIHIPFCRKACHYCNFHFSTSFKTKEELIGAMVVEIAMQAAYLDGQEIETIYFGGGTPSALPIEDIKQILGAIKDLHQYNCNTTSVRSSLSNTSVAEERKGKLRESSTTLILSAGSGIESSLLSRSSYIHHRGV